MCGNINQRKIQRQESIDCLHLQGLFKNYVDNMRWVGGAKIPLFVPVQGERFQHKGRYVIKKGQFCCYQITSYVSCLWQVDNLLFFSRQSKTMEYSVIHISVYYVQMRQKNGGNFSCCLGGTKGFLLTSQGNICSSEILLSLY